MTDTREQLTAVLLTALMVLSLVAIAGTGLAGSAAATEYSDAQSAVDADEPASIDAELEEASGTEQVYIVLDQYDGQLSDDRERAIAQLQEHAEVSQAAATEDIDALAGVDVVNTYWITNAIRAEVDTTAVDTAELATIDGAETIQLRPEYEVPEPEPSVEPAVEPDEDDYTYGLDQINASETWADFNAQGEDVKVAVLDTGFDIDHQDLDLYTEDADDPTYPGGWVEIDADGDPVEGSEPYDTHYHGTHVGGTVGAAAPADDDTPAYGVAPNVDLQHGLVLPDGSGADSDTIAGFEYVVEEMDSDVVSMSFGAGCGLFGPVYEDAWIPAIQNANDMDVVAVTSSGNSGEGCVGSPANTYDSFSIGASNADGDITDFSSGNTIAANNWDNPDPEWPDEWVKPDVAAPGEDVLSAMPDDEYDYLDGTSMAAPHVSGVIALMLSANDDLTQEEIEETLEETAWKPDGEPDEKDVRYGHGIVDAYAAVDEVAAGALEYELGDVDQDEAVTVQDVQLTQQYLQDMDPEPFAEDLADMNRDGEVTTDDLSLLQQKVQGMLDEGEIAITGLDVPDEVDDDETVEIDVDLENLGDEGAIQEIDFFLGDDDEPIDTEVVDMAAPGVDDPVDHSAETTITFDLDASDLDAGEHTVTVATEDDDASDAFTVLSSEFGVSNLDAPDEADRGDEITVSADIANTGNVDDTQTVEYRFDDLDDALLTQNVTLEPDEETTVSFDVDTENVTEGTYDHGVFTEDDEATAAIDILEAFFSVDITDAPEELAPGETYNVSADVVNAGDAPDEQTIAYDVTEGETDVAVVDGDVDEEELREELADRGVDEVDLDEIVDGADNLADTLQDELDDSYDVQTVNAANLLDEVEDYDIFVVNDFDGADVDAFLDELADDQGVVYLENWGSSSNAVSDLSDATDDPSSVEDGFSGSAPIMLDITDDHALFDGVADAGETIELHDGSAADRAWFDGYSGETIADVGDGTPDGASVGVSEDDDHVLLAAFGRSSFISNADFSAESNAIMANAVEHVDDYAGTASATDHTSEVVSLEPNESATVEFTNTLAEDDGELEWHHVVESDDDIATAPFTIDDGPNWNVKGTVSEAATDEPIENASVELEAGNETYTNVTDADGKYGLANVPAGEHTLTVDAENFAAHTELVEVPEDDVVTVDVGLEELPGTISGDVTASDDDAPVENATIVAENADGDVHETTTDENGSYELADVSAGTYVVNVVDTPPGYEIDEIVTVAPGEHVENVDFVVDRTAGSIEGTVTNAAGVPIADANVVDADDGAFNVTTAEDGTYEIEDVTPGTTALRAVADGYDDSNIEFVEVETGETTTANLTLGTYFEVDDLAAPDTAEKGEEITVNATVTNTGEQEDTRMVFYFPPGTDFGTDVIDYQPDLSETVTLEGSESTTVEFTYEIGADDEPGEYEHGISADEVESTVITIEGDEDDGEPVFDVADLDAPADAEPNETVSVTTTLENTGDDAGTQTVTYAFDDETVANETVSLDETESTVLEFTTELPADDGTYEHAVSSENDSATAQTTVEEAGEPEPAYFEVTEHEAPESVDAGEELTVNATITNTGDETDQQDVFLFWDSAMSDLEDAESVADLREAGIDSMESIELEGGESETVALTHEVDAETEPGTYQYTVSTLQEMADGEVTVESAAEAAFPADPGGFDGAPPGAALGANPFESGIANGIGLLG